ncbi:MAG: energy transducer TonB [Bacteroidales bacterium]|nr:energy transducer TonB [Bacteroidales bacterium]
MTNRDRHITLFTKQGCLTADAIQGIMKGELSVKQEKEVSKHLESCEFCREAIAGTVYFDDEKEFAGGISDLQKTWSAGSKKKYKSVKIATAGLVSIAAAFLVLLGVGIFYLGNKQNPGDSLSDNLTRGVLLDSAMMHVEIHHEKVDQKYAELYVYEQNSRLQYKADSTEKQLAYLIGKIENAEIYAKAIDPNKSGLEINNPKNMDTRVRHLRYPYVITNKPPPHIELKLPEEEYDRNDLFIIVEEMPEFRGGDLDLFRQYVRKNIQYPQEAIEKHISGRVYVQFTVNKTGILTDARLIKGVHPLLDREVLRVIISSPLWEPGKQRDKPVDVSILLPVDFYLY